MSSYEASSPESDIQCNSPDICDAPTLHAILKKGHTIDKSKRLKASARERKRRHVLNGALESLRLKVSCFNENSHKLSKIEILRLAIDYISMLTRYLNATDSSMQQSGLEFYHHQQQQQIVMQQPGMFPNLRYMHKQVSVVSNGFTLYITMYLIQIGSCLTWSNIFSH